MEAQVEGPKHSTGCVERLGEGEKEVGFEGSRCKIHVREMKEGRLAAVNK